MNPMQRNIHSLKLLGSLAVWGVFAGACGAEKPKAQSTQSPAPSRGKVTVKPAVQPKQAGTVNKVDDAAAPVVAKEAMRAAVQGEVWALVPQQSFVGIEVLKGKGEHYARFGRVSGKAMAKGKTFVGVEVEVRTESFEADIPAFADHVRSAQFLDVKTYPEARFVSTSLRLDPGPVDNRYMLEGDLTLRGIQQRVTMQADLVTKGGTMELKGQVPLEFKEFGMSQAGIANELIEGVRLSLRLQFKNPK